MKKELITYKLKSFAKSHFYIFMLLLLSLVFFSSILSSSKILDNIHYVNDMTFQSENIRNWLFESAGFPLWTPYFYAGQPFIAIPEHYIFDLNFIYILLFRNIFFSMNLAVISYFFLAGLGMYFLAYKVAGNRNAAFIAAIVFMFNGLMHSFILSGHLNILESYALMPFVFLFAYKAMDSGEWLRNSIIAALFFSMMVYAGGIIFFLYTGLVIGLYMAWNLIGKDFRKRFIKTAYVGFVIGILLMGLSALKLFPMLEFTKLSNRSAGVNYQEFLGEPIALSNFWNSLVSIPDTGFSGSIGIFSFILLLFGLISFRKKVVFFSVLLAILSVLLASGTFVANLFYQLPGFSQMRHIERAIVMFVFIAPLIVAFGYNNLIDMIKRYNRNIKEWVIFLIIVLVLTVELVLLQRFPVSAEITRPLDIPILNEISKDKSDFRIATHALSTPIGASGYNYYIQLGIPEIKGGGGIWVNDYVQYLAIAQQAAPSKMFGILNGKYIVSDRQLDDSGLTLKGTFEKCDECKIVEAYGPYLYENKNVVPRALVVDNAILLLGNDEDAMELSYSMVINNLNLLSSVLIRDKSDVANYKIDELKKFNALILLSNSVVQNDIWALQQYANNGGTMLPNILEGKNYIAQENINSLFDNLAGPETSKKELELRQKSVNEYYINLNGERGWLVISEKFAHFPAWKATLNGKELKIYKANIVVSAVYLDGGKGELIFKYAPSSFRIGKTITSIAILIMIAYLVYITYSRIKNEG